jgi:hypothetical protein
MGLGRQAVRKWAFRSRPVHQVVRDFCCWHIDAVRRGARGDGYRMSSRRRADIGQLVLLTQNGHPASTMLSPVQAPPILSRIHMDCDDSGWDNRSARTCRLKCGAVTRERTLQQEFHASRAPSRLRLNADD